MWCVLKNKVYLQDAYTTAIRNWEDVTLTKDEVRTLRRYLQRTMADIMARVATPSPSVGTSTGSSTTSADAGDGGEADVDAENSGHAASSGQRDKFLSYRYLVGTVNRLLSDVEEQDVRFRHVLGEAVSLQVRARSQGLRNPACFEVNTGCTLPRLRALHASYPRSL